MASLKTVLHPKTDSKGNKIYRLALRVTVNRKRSYIYHGQNLELKDWDKEVEKVKRSHPKYSQLNRLIRKKYDEVEDLIFNYTSIKKEFTAKSLTDEVKNNNNIISFFDFAEDFIVNLEKLGKHKRANPLRGRINQFKRFGNNGSDKLTFEEIDVAFLKNFKTNYIANRNVSERTVINVYIAIRTLYNLAIEENIVEAKHYPFGKKKIQIKFPETLKVGLNEKEFKIIENIELEKNSKAWHARNVFLFSFYLAGIRISDTLEMKWNAIIDERLHYNMSKNNKADSLKLNNKSLAILAYYEEEKRTPNDFIFPYLKKANLKDSKDVYNKTKNAIKLINEGLEQMRQIAKIDKKITNHISRHTFGNIAGDKISPKMLQKLYRHSNITTTMGYQKNFIHKSTDDALDSVINF